MIPIISIIVVWTTEYEEGQQKTKDHYEVFEQDEIKNALKLYEKLLDREDTVVASITGVIDSTDYEPYEFPNESEEQLEKFLDELDEERGFDLELHTQGMITGIDSDKAINLCTVKADKYGKIEQDELPFNTYHFGGISEAFYNKMVEKFTRYDTDKEEWIK